MEEKRSTISSPSCHYLAFLLNSTTIFSSCQSRVIIRIVTLSILGMLDLCVLVNTLTAASRRLGSRLKLRRIPGHKPLWRGMDVKEFLTWEYRFRWRRVFLPSQAGIFTD